MTRYLTYEEYREMGGTLAEADFTLAEYRAQKHIDALTDRRVTGMEAVPEEVKLCILELIKADGKTGPDALADGAIITGYSTDGYAENYGSAVDQIAAITKSAEKTVRDLLYGVRDDNGTPLLYRGLS